MNLRRMLDTPVPTIVLSEGEFGNADGKTGNGVVMHSTVFDSRVIIDSTQAGRTADMVLETQCVESIPIVSSMDDALASVPEAEAVVIGAAPPGGDLPPSWAEALETAIRAGCDIISGLHVFLSEQEMWHELATEHGTRLIDVRKPPDVEDLQIGDGSVDDVDATVVLTMGTDCAVGKRTTTFELYKAAVEAGIDAGWVGTGQTGIMIGAHEGIVIDRVPADFISGAVEELVCRVGAKHDVVFVEGQAALTHRSYSGVTLGLLHGAWPDIVVLADDPDRRSRTVGDFRVDGVDTEIDLIESLSEATVAAISTWGDPEQVEAKNGIPAANVYHEHGASDLLAAVQDLL
jgi:uncharacterized NAD-dependent epimerase/dehydratase family protein